MVMIKQVHLQDKTFEYYIDQQEIEQAIEQMANAIYEKYKNTTPVFIGVLKGSFMFISELCKFYPGVCEVAFMQVASYQADKRGDEVSLLMDVNMPIEQRDVILVEDIVDTGETYEMLHKYFNKKQVKSIALATLFLKPDVYKKKLKLDFVGKNIENRFVVGYGLDYNGLGRNLPDLYQLKND